MPEGGGANLPELNDQRLGEGDRTPSLMIDSPGGLAASRLRDAVTYTLATQTQR